MKRFYFKINEGEPVEIAFDPSNKETLTLELTDGDIILTDKEGNTCKLYSEVEE